MEATDDNELIVELAEQIRGRAALEATTRVANQNIMASVVPSQDTHKKLRDIEDQHGFKTAWPPFLFPVEWIAWGIDVTVKSPWPGGTVVSHFPGSEKTSTVRNPGTVLDLWRACDEVSPFDERAYIESIRHGPNGITVCFHRVPK